MNQSYRFPLSLLRFYTLKNLYMETFLCLRVRACMCPCVRLCDPMGCSPPGSSVLGILQARTLEWVAVPFSRGSSWPRDWTCISCTAGRFFTIWATREALITEVSLADFLLGFISHTHTHTQAHTHRHTHVCTHMRTHTAKPWEPE